MGSAFRKGDKVDRSRLRRGQVNLPELGEDKYLLVRALSAKEISVRQVQEKEARKKVIADAKAAGEMISDDELNRRIVELMPNSSGFALIAMCAINDDGSPVFDDEADCEANLDVAASSLTNIIKEILTLSGIPQDATKN